ncbi:MAG TPA: DsrE family protein [Chitinophagaceae bacterium]|nr:DsrE family protein [Chitinophagaceae bacterium]
MRKNIFVVFMVLLSPIFLSAQSDYKVVFDLTSNDTMNHKAVIRWTNEIIKASKDAQVEVVFYGNSLDMVQKDKSVVAGDVAKLSANKNVSFKVCSVAMKAHNVDKSQLIPGVETVPDGIYEIVTKQREGWAYIKGIR